ncbi:MULTISPECIES: Mo-dependent nitrogenase C-terminal domain-containing protein [unclassified Coleofasciculus]|uniref:Mo-dependent nitrogenase C-terminal domain-containing protein n=1 Tax=unclassified Coleofasciculus TaxID=2692782 RepID=UPI0018823666|nr:MULTISPECIES: Mo-dependent nitrogenase C-terminal domain-containing protein [unclassified Coleofasciculus]MBE9126636.1 TerB family tellurite resistance protein [Coleofasciculus sp. LEGE 07081]MBE9148888.1 TerB family tellurite resistance protein [Coleofasciculus sp. LEGE 07092]
MTSITQSHYTEEQIAAWLRGLCTVAWADGHFDPEEKEIVAQLTQEELASDKDLQSVEQTISPEELSAALGKESDTAENFLRTAVMVAMADGIYSATEADVLEQFSEALGLQIEALSSLRHMLYDNGEVIDQTDAAHNVAQKPGTSVHPHSDILQPVRSWLDEMKVHDPRVARVICKMIPSQCPFERDVNLFGRKIAHIPAMCKINPLYDQLVGLRFRALSYLADERGEDVSNYF